MDRGVARMERFYAHSGNILKIMPRIASKRGATLKEMNLIPSLGAKSFFKNSAYFGSNGFIPVSAAPVVNKPHVLLVDISLLQIILFSYA